jgi:WD40 repeat protein
MRLSSKTKGLFLVLSLFGTTTIYMSGIIPSMAGGTPIAQLLALKGGVATAVTWSSDGQKLAAYGNYGQSVEVWTKDGRHITTMSRTGFDIPYIYDSISFINDDHFILTPPDGTSLQNQKLTLSLWSTGTGKVIRNVDGPDPGADWLSNFAYLFAVSTNDKFVVAVTRTNQNVSVFPVKEWDHPVKLRLREQDNSGIVSITISSDGLLVGLGNVSGQVSIYDAKTGQFTYAIQAYDQIHMTPVQSLSFNPEGTEIATGAGAGIASSETATPVRVWSAKDGRLIRAFEESNLQPIRNLKWSLTGEYIGFSSIDDKLRIWNQITGKKRYVSLSDRGSMCLAFSPDGRSLAFCDGNNVKILKLTD